MLIHYKKKINCITLKKWTHHNGGWNFVTENLNMYLHNNEGIDCYTNGIFNEINNDTILKTPWVGICHFGLKETESVDFSRKCWQESLNKCKGIFVHSNIIKNYLKSKINNHITSLWHPVPPAQKKFEKFCNKIIFVGRWMRRHDRFEQLISKFNVFKLTDNNYISTQEYEEELSKSLIFIDMYDSSCNNTILECIIRNTPMIICKLPTVVEYLGDEYPLYFENIEEMNYKSNNIELIYEAHEYLKKIDKKKFHIKTYLKEIYHSEIYKNL